MMWMLGKQGLQFRSNYLLYYLIDLLKIADLTFCSVKDLTLEMYKEVG